MSNVTSVSQLLGKEAMSQVSSVSQLKDVQPTDWAYQALRSLVEQYGCIVGYPDRTFRGNRAMSRWEFAAGLNACINSLERLLQENIAVAKADIDKLTRLAKEFETELAVLGTRIENLENRVAYLEDHQFSTTTKLTGQTFFNLTGAFVDGSVKAERGVASSPFAPPRRNPTTNLPSVVEREQPQVTLSYYTLLTLTTSFNGKDALVTQLNAGNGDSPANQLVSAGYYNSWGVPYTDQTGAPTANDVVIRELFYSFRPVDSLQVVIGPRVNFYRYFDNNRFTFFVNGAGSFNSSGSTLVSPIDRGSGFVLAWNITKQLKWTVSYLGESNEFLNTAFGYNTANNPKVGLFNPSNIIATEIGVSPIKNMNLRFLYMRSNNKAYNGFVGGAVGEPLPYGYADDGFGGNIKDAPGDAVVFNFDWLITRRFGIFGRYSYGATYIYPIDKSRESGQVSVQSIQAGLAFPDLFKEGTLGVLSFLIPQDYISGRRYLLSGRGNGGTQYEIEASYFYPITKNIAVVPSFYTIFNPNNFDDNPTVFVGNLRTQFTF
ncbi:iron uptake porin [Aphanothece hegewaldii]